MTPSNRAKKIYLHCQAGIGRTGTVVGCYLVRHGLSGRAALSHLNELRRRFGVSGLAEKAARAAH